MTNTEHLLTCLLEECSEVSKNISKALRFGLQDSDPNGAPIVNAKTISLELTDLIGVAEMCLDKGIIPPYDNPIGKQQKKLKVKKYMQYARKKGTLV